MRGRYKIVFSAAIALLFTFGLLKLPDIEPLVKSCSGTFICGADLDYVLKFLGKTDGTAIAFGHYLYQKFITASIVFLITLILTTMAHRIYVGNKEN